MYKAWKSSVSNRVRNVASLLVLLLVFSGQALALDLQTAKNQGLIGETSSGYLEIVTDSVGVSKLVQEINAQRKAEYARIAAANGIAVSDVEALAAKKAIAKTPAGQFVKVNGQWQKK